MKDSLRWALENGRHVVPVLEVVWKSRGQTIQTDRFAPSGHDWPETFAHPLVTRGGFGGIKEGPSILPGTLEPCKTRVTIMDADQTWASFLERYNPKYSLAKVWLASPDLVQDDWDPLFDGLLDGWESDGPTVSLNLGSDDRALYAECPKPIFERAVWGYAPDPTIFGIAIPFVMGEHDAYQITARGMVTATCVEWDENKGYRWLASGKLLKNIPRIFYDGLPQTFTFTVERGVYGSCEATLISVPKANIPTEKQAIVAFDCSGPDTTGDHTGTTLTSPVEQLRIALINYVFGDLRCGPYATTHPRIHAASWDAVSARLTAREYESARVLGGNREKQTGVGLVESFLTALHAVRMWWTASGQIKMGVVALEDDDPTDEYTNLSLLDPAAAKHTVAAADVYTDVDMSYMYSNAEQAFLASYLAQDVGLAETLQQISVLLLENPWSQARFSSE